MTRSTNRHNIIAGNLLAIFRSRLRGTGCRVYVSDVKLRIDSINSFYYPDIMVSCEPYGDNTCSVKSPCLIVEILSHSTAAIDRREKMLAYRQIPDLQEYAIVHQRRQLIEMHRRNPDNSWVVHKFGPANDVEFRSIPGGALQIPLSAVYEEADFDDDLHDFVRESSVPGYSDPEPEWLRW